MIAIELNPQGSQRLPAIGSQTRAARGFVLVTGLVFLLVIAVVAVSGMQVTTLDYKISVNNAFKDISFQASESGRTAVGDAVDGYVYERSWVGVEVHDGIVKADDYDPLDAVGESENLFDTSSLTKDMDFTIASGSSAESVDADIYIIKHDAPSLVDSSGLQQLSGYRGMGKSAAAGGSALYFELRSKGYGGGRAESVTASDYRSLIQ